MLLKLFILILILQKWLIMDVDDFHRLFQLLVTYRELFIRDNDPLYPYLKKVIDYIMIMLKE